MARRLGNDTLFVLAYSTIQLNTDAWNPGCPGPLGAFSRLSIFHGESVFSMAFLCVRAGRLTRTRRFPARAVEKRMSQRDFIDNNRRSPDLVNLTEAYLNEVYAEIQIAEIKIKDEEGTAGAARVISDCHFAVQLNRFIPGFLSYSVAVFLK